MREVGNNRPKSGGRDRRPGGECSGLAAAPAPVPAGASLGYGKMARQHSARWIAGQSVRANNGKRGSSRQPPDHELPEAAIQGQLVRTTPEDGLDGCGARNRAGRSRGVPAPIPGFPRPTISLDSDLRNYNAGGSRYVQRNEGGIRNREARRATEAGPDVRSRRKGRWSARRKVTVVLELLRGEDLEAMSRQYGVTAAALTRWREAFLQGEDGLKSRIVDVVDEERKTLKSALTSLVMDKELLRERSPASGGREAFSTVEVEAMSRTLSPSTHQLYGLGPCRSGLGVAPVDVLCSTGSTEPSGRAA